VRDESKMKIRSSIMLAMLFISLVGCGSGNKAETQNPGANPNKPVSSKEDSLSGQGSGSAEDVVLNISCLPVNPAGFSMLDRKVIAGTLDLDLSMNELPKDINQFVPGYQCVKHTLENVDIHKLYASTANESSHDFGSDLRKGHISGYVQFCPVDSNKNKAISIELSLAGDADVKWAEFKIDSYATDSHEFPGAHGSIGTPGISHQYDWDRTSPVWGDSQLVRCQLATKLVASPKHRPVNDPISKDSSKQASAPKELNLDNVLRDDNGFARYVNHDQAQSFCQAQGGKLPSVEDFVDFAVKNGSKGIVATGYPNGASSDLESVEIKRMESQGYTTVYRITGGHKQIAFYYNNDGYKFLGGGRRFWTSDSAPLPDHPQAAAYFYIFGSWDGHFYGGPAWDEGNQTICLN